MTFKYFCKKTAGKKKKIPAWGNTKTRRQKLHTKFQKKFTRKEMVKDWGKQAFCTFFIRKVFRVIVRWKLFNKQCMLPQTFV